MAAYENILVETRGRVGLIRLNRPAALNALVRERVIAVYDHKYINRDLPEFATMTATAENMAIDIRDRLLRAWPAEFPALARVGVQETKRNVIGLPVIEEVV